MDGLGHLAERYVKATYVQQGIQSIRSRRSELQWLLIHARMPRQGWSDALVQFVLDELSTMDSNNFPGNVGVGEFELSDR
jgi:O-phospho-L-seryl-tRNASec:L-selenocysteinyl-tRNA synthase